MEHSCKKGYIVLSGPFRRFDNPTDAEEAAKTDTLTTGTDHVVIAVNLSHCDQEVAPESTSDAELLRAENAKLRKDFEAFKASLVGAGRAAKPAATPPVVYRRLKGSGVWHYRPDCSNWPTKAESVERKTAPDAKNICDECRAKEEHDKG